VDLARVECPLRRIVAIDPHGPQLEDREGLLCPADPDLTV
jgi:hypothetical protein